MFCRSEFCPVCLTFGPFFGSQGGGATPWLRPCVVSTSVLNMLETCPDNYFARFRSLGRTPEQSAAEELSPGSGVWSACQRLGR